MFKIRSTAQRSFAILRRHTNVVYVLVYTSALRGSNVALLIVLSHFVDVATFGKISAVYVFVMSGAQIIGLPLTALALRSIGQSGFRTIQYSVLWWAVISFLLITMYFLFEDLINTLLFSDKIEPSLIAIGCFWMCAMSLEILSSALAASSGKLKTMAVGSVLQAAATLAIVPAGVWLLGDPGLFLVPVCGLIAGATIVARVFEWRDLSVAYHEWRRGATSHLIITMGPAAIAALSVTLLNMTLVSITTTSPEAFLTLATFAIALQLVGVSTFIPQVLSNSALESGHRAARNGGHWRKILVVWALISFGVSGAIGAVVAALGGSFSVLYAEGYALSPGLLIATGLLVALVGPVNVLSHVLIIGGRQWLSAAICLASTLVVIGCFVLQSSRSSEAMMWALVASNAIRLLALSGFASLELHHLRLIDRRQNKPVRDT